MRFPIYFSNVKSWRVGKLLDNEKGLLSTQYKNSIEHIFRGAGKIKKTYETDLDPILFSGIHCFLSNFQFFRVSADDHSSRSGPLFRKSTDEH